MLFFFPALFEACVCGTMAGRGRGQSGQLRGRGRGGVLVGEAGACLRGRSGEDFRPYDDTDFEGAERGRPAPRVDYGDEQHRLPGRSQGGSVPASQVSDLGTPGFVGLGRCTEELVRGRGRGRGVGSVRPVKGKNFVPEEERQLTRSVLAISQDPICGNQQKGNAFWERIFLHYEQCRPGGHRGARSLESKWGTIKHDVGKFIGAYNQVKRLNRSGSKEADIIRMAKDLYRSKSAKNTEFMFEHCWELVKDFPRWADGVSPSRQTTPSRRVSGSSDHESQSGSQVDTQKSVSPVETTGEATTIMAARPTGTKAAKDAQRGDKVHEIAALTQAKAAEKMAEATLRKAASLEYHNMLLLFTAPMDQVTTPEAQEFIRLLREEELLKLRRRRAESHASELRERNEREVNEISEAAREREEAANKAREDEETVRQMREAHAEFGEDCDLDINYEGRQSNIEPGDREILELQDSDEEDPQHCKVGSNLSSGRLI